ncbi:MAG: hypothetical protein HRT41_03010 [Campylobacteraceae bacterium]|nr:hypothetical protein [Campylobacteraceae bacterium]
MISEKKLLQKLLKKLNTKVKTCKGTVKSQIVNDFIEYNLSPSIESLEKSKIIKELREKEELNENNDL